MRKIWNYQCQLEKNKTKNIGKSKDPYIAKHPSSKIVNLHDYEKEN